MYFGQLKQFNQIKHLRGKHDQRDHGRRGIGQGIGGVSSAVASITGLDSVERSSTIDATRTIATQAYNGLASTITDPRERLDRVRDAMKMQTKNLNNEVKQRNALLRTIDRRVKKGGEPASQSERDRIREFDRYILSSATSFEFLREQYNAELTTFQAQQRQAAKDRAKAKRDQAKNPTPKPATTYTPESLQDIGLGGWTRFRPDTPPDFTAYDQAIPGRPEWMNEPRLNDLTNYSIGSNQRPPRNFRRVTQTPEGNPVLTVGMKEGETIVDFANRPDIINEEPEQRLQNLTNYTYKSDTWRAGEALFSKQNSKAEDFWLSKPYPRSDLKIGSAVSRYGGALYDPVNGFLRKIYTPKSNRERKEVIDNVRVMDGGMQPAPKTIFTRRGVGAETFRRMQEHLNVGDQFTDDSFTSASVNPMFNWYSDKKMFNIIITEGTPTLWTDSMALGQEECEVIIGRGVTFEVVSADNTNGWILRTIPPEGLYEPPVIPTS
jgi:hypothetical protein